MKFYAYCLSDEVKARTVESEIGLAGAKPRLIQCGEIAAVVSEFDDEKAAVTRENVLAHERIVQRVLVETTPLPFRFGTIVNQARLQSYLNSQQASLRAQLQRVRGCVEMSVKVIWKPEAVKHEDERGDARAESAGGAGQTTKGSGTAFLAAKRREILGDETLKVRAEELAAWLAACLGDVVREALVSLQPSESLVLSAAHLVERARLDEYREALRQAQRERVELHFLTSGAWPPYSFTSAGS
jgi:Gas vesicle synthesis protein GvpL/GvpF